MTDNNTALLQHMAAMATDMLHMRTDMAEIAKGMTRLAVLEEKNQSTVAWLLKVSEKVDKVELDQVRAMAMADGVSKTVKAGWAVFGGLALYLATQLVSLFWK